MFFLWRVAFLIRHKSRLPQQPVWPLPGAFAAAARMKKCFLLHRFCFKASPQLHRAQPQTLCCCSCMQELACCCSAPDKPLKRQHLRTFEALFAAKGLLGVLKRSSKKVPCAFSVQSAAGWIELRECVLSCLEQVIWWF